MSSCVVKCNHITCYVMLFLCLDIGPEQGEKETLDAFKKLMSQNQVLTTATEM